MLFAQFLAGLSQTAFEGDMDARVAEEAPPRDVTTALAYSASTRALGGSVAVKLLPMMATAQAVNTAVSGAVLLDTPNATLLVPRGASAFVAAGEAPLIVRPAADAHGSTDGPVLAFAVTVGDSRAL